MTTRTFETIDGRKLEFTVTQEQSSCAHDSIIPHPNRFYDEHKHTYQCAKCGWLFSHDQLLLLKFGGKDKVNDATNTKAMDDVYCWELKKWFNHKYWVTRMKDTHTGVTLRELVIAAKL